MIRLKLSLREKLLLPLGFFVIGLVFYTAFRWKPALASVSRLQGELRTAVERREGLQYPAGPAVRIESLRRQHGELELALTNRLTRLEAMEATLVDLDFSNDLQLLKIQLSDLAQRHRVHIVSSVPTKAAPQAWEYETTRVDPRSRPLAPVVHELFLDRYSRPWRDLTLRSSYMGLVGFLEGFRHLRWQVTVVAISVRVSERAPGMGTPSLDTTLTLAF